MANRSQEPDGRLGAAEAGTHGLLTDADWAWEPYKPDADRPWDLRLVGHLYRRAAFGANWGQLQQALNDGPHRTIDGLLQPDGDVEAFNRTHDGYEASVVGSKTTDALSAWWLRRMLSTPHPLLEKMTLFWHNHFATSNARVGSARLMRDHLHLLRGHALGRFEPLLEGVAHDPATLMWLDSDANRKALLNESLPRALMEVFALGPQSFTDRDVREAARAFTGWFVLQNKLRYIPREHDSGVKKVLGQEGNWGSKDVVRIVLEQSATPRLLVRKLYRWLISETDEPSDALIAPLAKSLAEGYDVAQLVETMLRSNLFFSPAAYRRRVKCPVEFAVGIVTALEAIVSTSQLGGDMAALGQKLLNPPTVRGWVGGCHWINTSTVVARSNLALALLSGSDPYGKKLDALAVAARHGHSGPEDAGRFVLDLFLQGDVAASTADALREAARGAARDPSRRIRHFAHGVVTLPEFQLA